VPGGKWVLAIHSNNPFQQQLQKVFNIMIWFLGLMLGWFAYTVLEQRSTLARLALYDGLTGLPNRVLVQDRVDHAMSIQRRDQQRNYLLLFIDLDGFKQVNDQMGHKAGDIVLQQVAQRIARVLRDTDTVSRWGGDEFIVFMEQVDPAMAQTIIEKIRTAVEMPVNVGNREARVGASIGTAVAPADGTNLAVLARAADERMYAEKRRRKSDEGVR
ncbi:MAG: GGDEF domain-containing protein, partial [Burkholderiales bacterium]